MRRRDFDRTLRRCTTKTRLDVAKIKALDNDTKTGLAHHIVRCRGPLLVELAAVLDGSWLNSMGYLYTTTSPSRHEYTFRHTAEHTIR